MNFFAKKSGGKSKGSATVQAGTSIGRYHIIEELGRGGMATVYRAYDTRLRKDVAVKLIRLTAFDEDDHPQLLARFDQEAASLARLTHPNIIQIIDFDTYGDIPFLVMPFIPGGTLKQRIEPMAREGRRMSPVESARLLLPIARALDYAHQRKLLHRDVKPANILITDSGEPMLSDFGIARILDSEGKTLTATGVGIGTPEYMAPEQGMGHPVPASDQYALGIILYELLTGRKPYTADTPIAVLLKQASSPLPPPRQFVPDLSADAERVLFTALAKEPENRFATMADFAQAMEAWLGQRHDAPAGNGKQHPDAAPEEEQQSPAPPEQPEVFPTVQILTDSVPEEAPTPEPQPEPEPPILEEEEPVEPAEEPAKNPTEELAANETTFIGQPPSEDGPTTLSGSYPDPVGSGSDPTPPIPDPVRGRSFWLVAGLVLVILALAGGGWVWNNNRQGEAARATAVAQAAATHGAATHGAATRGAEMQQALDQQTAPTATETPTVISTPKPTATRLPTRTRTPTQTSTPLPTDIPADKFLYQWDFENGIPSSWDNRSSTAIKIVEWNGNHYMHFTATGFAYPGIWREANKSWDNYAFESKIKLKDYGVLIVFRYGGKPGAFYNVSLNPYEDYIVFADYDPSRAEDKQYQTFAGVNQTLINDRWYIVRIEVQGEDLRVFIDNQLVTSAKRASLDYGGIAYYTGENGTFDIDDIRVWSLNP